LLRRFGFAPKHIVDVGANRGYWTRTAFKYFPDAVYTLVEPQDHLKFYTQDLIAQGCKLNWINAGCGDFSGTLPLFVSYRDDGSTFVLTDWNRNSTKSQRITVPMMTLNQIVASSRAGLPEMVKIDAEGFDLKVLAGASDLLGKTDIFLVEAAVGPRAYDNSVAEVVRSWPKPDTISWILLTSTAVPNTECSGSVNLPFSVKEARSWTPRHPTSRQRVRADVPKSGETFNAASHTPAAHLKTRRYPAGSRRLGTPSGCGRWEARHV